MGHIFAMLAASKLCDYSFDYMRQSFFSGEKIDINPSEFYIDSEWDSQVIVNEGYWSTNEGEFEGRSFGGNFLTFNLTMGSEFMPDISDSVIFMEANSKLDFKDVQNQLQAILNQTNSHKIKGLLIGRFQKDTGMTRDLLNQMIRIKKELQEVPVAANVDFGYTAPMTTLPIGGKIKLQVQINHDVRITVEEH